MKIYFDACCVNRLTDDQEQERVRTEAEAIEALIGFSSRPDNTWVGSAVLEAEISRNANPERRKDAEALLAFVRQNVELDDQIVDLARELQQAGFSEMDALHLACAGAALVDVFLTTDDRLLRRANRIRGKLDFRVLNPVSFLEEVENVNSRND